VDNRLRKRLGELAIKGAKNVDYVGAGTIEFLLDPQHNFYFMEMNTRIQVEHPVTEMVTGVDLIKEQIRVAAGEKLRFQQDDIKIMGAAMECRINAEDPENNFLPHPGRIETLNLPGGPGVRVDTHIYPGYEIPSYYDSLLAKVITHGNTRGEAIRIMQRALNEFNIAPIKTTIPFHLRLLENSSFLKGETSTHFIQEMFKEDILQNE
jgi:acetyl-CoA carboxylase biotin carboxylase subunit